MAEERLNTLQTINKETAAALFTGFSHSISVLEITPVRDSMSNSNYIVTTTAEKYLLKLYSNSTDDVETGVYSYLKDKINVPSLLYYDAGKQVFPVAFAILEYIDSDTLRETIRKKNKIAEDIIFEIGRMCAVLHGRTYPYDALIDCNLAAREQIPNTHERILELLNGRAGKHLQPQTVHAVCNIIQSRTDLFDRIEQESVFCHGDLNYGNILIQNDTVFFIDFEFAYAGSRFHDIGHFFRRKSDDIQSRIGRRIYEAFACGYNAISPAPLREGWLALAHLCDIAPMLCLLNREDVPAEWVSDIEYDIRNAIAGQ